MRRASGGLTIILAALAFPFLSPTLAAPTAKPDGARETARTSGASSTPARLIVTAGAGRIHEGDLFSVVVHVRGARDVGGAAFHVVYDPTRVKPIAASFTEGPWMRQGGASTSFLAAPASTGDRVVVGNTRLGSPRGARSRGVICRLTFRAVAAGPTAIGLDRAHLTDPRGLESSSESKPASLEILPPAGTGSRR